MTTKEFVSLEKSLLPEFPGFAIKGPLMFIPPAERLLRGISFEGSSFDKTSFSVSMFVMPLCVPTKHLYLNFGNRVRHKGGGDRWNMEMPNLVTELGSRVETPSDTAFVARRFPSRLRSQVAQVVLR